MSRDRSCTSIDIYFSDIIGDIPTKMLEDELAGREDRGGAAPDPVPDLIEAIREGDRNHLRIVLDRWMPGAGALI